MSKLDLRTREAMLTGGERGPALAPGDAARSRLVRLASHIEEPAMPPGKKLQGWQIEVLRRWVGTGAPMPENFARASDKAAALASLEERPITEREKRFWAFQPVRRVEPPPVRRSAWARGPVDAFLLASMERRGLKPAPAADRRTLIRRAYLDLTGLPPEPAQVESFLKDDSPDAWEKLVDRLLASPHYGERWGRHWLDLVRYSDSGGYEFDRDRPNAWRYRDWVVRAFNQDAPYDRFVREQIAGDEISPGSRDARIGTGFLRMGPEANIKSEMTRMDELDDILATTAGALLGVTLACARCHNHKFDPIPQKDYYRIQAVFFPTKSVEAPLESEDAVARHKAALKGIEELATPLRKQREALEKPYRDRLREEAVARLPEYVRAALGTPPEKRTEGQKLNALQVEKTQNFTDKEVLASMTEADRAAHREVSAKIASIERSRPRPLAAAMAIGEEGAEAPPSYFLHRGSPDQKGSRMEPGVLSVASTRPFAVPAPEPGATSSGRRRAFADWVASPENPLTARVMVNRIWQHHFGEGIVRTPNNFGATGERPTHPDLLDWLASEFVRAGWSVKAMHRLLMTSSVYRMASDDQAANAAIDPENRLLWRMPRRRLEGEIIRDSILAAAGSLDLASGGPGIHPYIDPSLFQGSSGRTWQGRPDSDPRTWRRSLYVFSKRTIPLPMLEAFDSPDAIGSCARRNRSTIAPQALILMNNAFVRMQAGHFARRLEREAGDNPARQVEHAFQVTLARPPLATERDAALSFLQAGPDSLVDFCQALFNLNEFVYLP